MLVNFEQKLDKLTDFIFGQDPYLTDLKALQAARDEAYQIFKKDPVGEMILMRYNG